MIAQGGINQINMGLNPATFHQGFDLKEADKYGLSSF